MTRYNPEKRILGKSNIAVTAIGLGLWGVGGASAGPSLGPTDDKESLVTIEAAFDASVNFFDTADTYGNGRSEELLGQVMRGRRDKFVVATKIAWKDFDSERRVSAYDTVEKLIAGVESSLRRLQTDYVDVIQSHINFRDPTMEIFLEGFQKLQQDGKVRAYGVSTGNFKYLQQFNADGGCATLQVEYNILNRTPETDILPYCMENSIGVIVRGPLAMGILTGKFNVDSSFVEGDVRRRWQGNTEEREIFLEGLARVEQLRPLAQKRTLPQLALQFALAHPAVTTVIPGAKTSRQLFENLGALLTPTLTADELAHIDAITPPGRGCKIRS